MSTSVTANKAMYTHRSTTERHPADDYPTPPGFVRPILEVLQLPKDTSICDPCAGGGHLVRALADEGYTELWFEDLHYSNTDFFEVPVEGNEWDWVVTNPPYKHAEAFVRKALQHARHGVAMLLNSAFLESVGRAEGLFSEHPPSNIYMCARRMRLVAGNSSAFSHVWVVWHRDSSGPTQFNWVVPTTDIQMPTGQAEGVWQ